MASYYGRGRHQRGDQHDPECRAQAREIGIGRAVGATRRRVLVAYLGLFCVFGGRIANPNPTGAAFPDTFCFNPMLSAWSSGPDMITPRVEIATVGRAGVLFTLGG